MTDGLAVHRIVVSKSFDPYTLKVLNSYSLESTADGSLRPV